MNIKIIVGIACCCLLALFFYLSVLGENEKAIRVVKSFMTEIKDKNYSSIEQSYSKSSSRRFKSLNESMSFHFMLELALLQHFDLIDDQNYKVKVKRESFWFPLLSKNELHLGISLLSIDNTSIFPSFKKKKLLERFITATREDGVWKLKTININKSKLNNSFKEMQSTINLDKYVQIDQDGFVLNQTIVNNRKISAINRRIIIHSLETAIETLKKKMVNQN